MINLPCSFKCRDLNAASYACSSRTDSLPWRGFRWFPQYIPENMRQCFKIICTHRFGYFPVYDVLHVTPLELDALVRNYHCLLRNNQEEHCTQLLRGRNMKSRLDALRFLTYRSINQRKDVSDFQNGGDYYMKFYYLFSLSLESKKWRLKSE